MENELNKQNKWNRLENKQNKWNGIELAGASSLIQTFDSIKNLTPTLPNYILIYLYLHYQTMRNVNDQQSKIIDKNTKNWYTIDALGVIFAIFTILNIFCQC